MRLQTLQIASTISSKNTKFALGVALGSFAVNSKRTGLKSRWRSQKMDKGPSNSRTFRVIKVKTLNHIEDYGGEILSIAATGLAFVKAMSLKNRLNETRSWTEKEQFHYRVEKERKFKR